jgi:hypothetical protein
MAIVKLAVAFCRAAEESVTCALMLKFPEAVGVPEIAPLLVFRLVPGGKVPLTLH